jgi:hypothetical protein
MLFYQAQNLLLGGLAVRGASWWDWSFYGKALWNPQKIQSAL